MNIPPKIISKYAIIHASKNGHIGIVKSILKNKYANPNICFNSALTLACLNNNKEIVYQLLGDRRTIIKRLDKIVTNFILHDPIALNLFALCHCSPKRIYKLLKHAIFEYKSLVLLKKIIKCQEDKNLFILSIYLIRLYIKLHNLNQKNIIKTLLTFISNEFKNDKYVELLLKFNTLNFKTF